jgi:glycosyltransferase involved in cell wall biosynthesis
MTSAAPPIVLLYDDDAYVERVTPQGAGPAVRGLMGRQVAGKEFLDAYLTHGTWDNLAALVRSPASAASLLRLCRDHPSSRGRVRGLRVVEQAHFHRDFFPTPPAPLLYTPCPPDPLYAWARQHGGPGAFALCGVTHTLCSAEAARCLCEMVTAPFEPYDALVCTSRAVVDLVRAITDSYAGYLRERQGGEPRLRVRLELIPLGVHTERFHPPTPEERAARRHELGATDDEVVVLFVGRLAHHAKAHPFPMFHGLARAARETGRKAHLILAGWAPNEAIHAAFVEGARACAPGVRVSVVNGADPAVRFGVWHAADVFASLVDNLQETFGLAVVEAMAAGLPVVASDWDGYRDLVLPGETGYLVPTIMVSGATADATSRLLLGEVDYDHFLAECSQAVTVDAAAAAAAFARLLSDAALRKALGEAGRRRAQEVFAWPHVIRAYESLSREQERERQARAGGRPERSPGSGPACYPAPKESFAGYPSRWLRDEDLLRTTAGAEERLGVLLALPLMAHVGYSRSTGADLLRAVLAATAEPRPLAEVEAVLRQAGVDPVRARATVAWLLKYDLLHTVPD